MTTELLRYIFVSSIGSQPGDTRKMNQVIITNNFQAQATYTNVTRNAFMVGQVKRTATIPQVDGVNVPSSLLKIFFLQTVTLI
ncbi:hypothetical protein [Flavitalea sp.]|nr:hypothetical protein [Flavitalea sp.]